jgi:hypothetical protein
MGAPLYRLTLSRKDKENIRHKDYKGETVEKRHMPIGAIFQGEDGRLFISAKEPFKYNPDEHWMNIFAVEERDEDEAPKSKKPAGKKPAGKGKASKKQEDDEEDPFED